VDAAGYYVSITRPAIDRAMQFFLVMHAAGY
jgi:hypothetical protein